MCYRASFNAKQKNLRAMIQPHNLLTAITFFVTKKKNGGRNIC